jgi:CheY-like chemotaxis protein
MSEGHKPTTKILIAEDNMLNQKLIAFMIKGWGMESTICNNGEQAVEKLKVGNYDLVLMDLQMPVMDGYEAVSKIRKELNSDIPIIALTATESDSEKEKCTAAGMNAYVTKPINEEQLRNVISGFVLNSGIEK